MANRRVIYPSDPSDQYYTPRALRSLALEVFEGLPDIDPCTSQRNPMRARHFYTSRGLHAATSWGPCSCCRRGPVFCSWMNPPFGRGIGPWLERWTFTQLALQAQMRTTKPQLFRSLLLVPSRTGTNWYQHLTDERAEHRPQLVCELRGRYAFEDAGGNPLPEPARWDLSLVYWGQRRARAASILREHGNVRMLAPSLAPPRATESHDPRQRVIAFPTQTRKAHAEEEEEEEEGAGAGGADEETQ